MTQDNIVMIGKKELVHYELRVRDLIDAGKEEVIMESMGVMNNGKTLDLAEVLKRKTNLKVVSIQTETTEKEVGEKESEKFKRRFTLLTVIMSK